MEILQVESKLIQSFNNSGSQALFVNLVLYQDEAAANCSLFIVHLFLL